MSNVSGTSCKVLGGAVTPYKERLACYLKKLFQRIRNAWQVTWRRFQNVSGTSCTVIGEDVTPKENTSWKLLKEVVPMYEERLGNYLKKMLQRDVWTYQTHLACYLKKLFQHIRNVFKVTSRRCYNVSGTSCKWRHEDCRTYQEHLASYLATMLHRKKKRLASSMSQSS